MKQRTVQYCTVHKLNPSLLHTNNRLLQTESPPAMASAFLRTSRLRRLYHSLHSQSLRPSNFHSQDYRLLLPFISRGHPRLLSTNASTPAVNHSSPSSGSAEGTSSGKGEDAGGSQKGKPVRGGPISWMSLFLLLCTGAGLVYYYDSEKKQRIKAITTASSVVKEGASVGKAAIGGPFDLIDHNGKPVSDKDFFGKWTIIYFGFTHCPDICPDELQKLASAIDLIKTHSGLEIVPVFISVDPERDTVEQVREYVKEFHPMLIGLTGSPEQVKKAARAYRVYYMKTQDDDSDYLVDHSIAMYLMDPNMEFVKFFGKNLGDKELAEGVIKEMKQHKLVKV